MARTWTYLSLLLVAVASPLGSARAAKPAVRTDGQHDFDFALGTFKSRVRRLQQPLTGSTTWIEGTGTVSVRKVLGGRGNLEEIELDMPNGHLEALTLRLYDARSRQWNLYWSNARSGVVAQPPSVGGFKDGRGEFYDQETYDGKPILVRHVYSAMTADSYHFEQAFSVDGGKTWEANWIADVNRADLPPPSLSAEDRNHDFDFNFGKWKTHVSRLRAPLSGSKAWLEYDGTAEVTPVWSGRASVLELRVQGPAGTIEGVGLRLWDAQAKKWSLNWASARDTTLGVPMIGEFKNGRGEFVDVEPFEGRQIFVRNVFSEITPKSSRFEQAFSADAEKTWETNWVMTFTAAQPAERADRAAHDG